MRLGDFASGEEARGARSGAEALGAAEEDFRGVGFGEEEVEEDADWTGKLGEGRKTEG